MLSLQSIALLALTGAVSAYPWTEDHVARGFEDDLPGSNLMARDAESFFDNFDDLTEVYQRDIGEPYLEGQVLVRSAKGGSRPSKSTSGGSSGGHQKFPASKILKGVGKGASAFGDIGSGLSGVADIAGLFKGNGNGNSGGTTHSRRYLEKLYGSGLFAREARHRRERPGASSLGHIASSVGHGASRSLGAFDHLGQGLGGISDFAGLFRGNGGSGSSGSSSSNTKRDLEDLLDDALEIYARELDLEDLEY